MKKGKLIVLSGPSGAGKGTICKLFLEKNPNVALSISATTRLPRVGEVDGVNYHFKTKEDFIKMIDNDELLEYAKVFDNYYGTPKNIVLDTLQNGQDIILEIDVQGALQIKEKFSEGIFVFVLPPSLSTLKERIVGRGSETSESLAKRLGEACSEIEVAVKYDYFIINDTLETAVAKLEHILCAEKCRISLGIKEILCKIKEGNYV